MLKGENIITDTTTILIYVALFFIGLVVGNTFSYKRYQKLILEVLDNLKFTDKISPEEYEYYKEKFIKQKDSLKGIKDFMKKQKEKKNNE